MLLSIRVFHGRGIIIGLNYGKCTIPTTIVFTIYILLLTEVGKLYLWNSNLKYYIHNIIHYNIYIYEYEKGCIIII